MLLTLASSENPVRMSPSAVNHELTAASGLATIQTRGDNDIDFDGIAEKVNSGGGATTYGRSSKRRSASCDAVIGRCKAALLSPLMETLNGTYTIVWSASGNANVSVVDRTVGTHPFLNFSKEFAFTPGSGFVGRLHRASVQYELLADIVGVSPDDFLRKQHALVSGIRSIVFLPQRDGTLLEIGFECRLDMDTLLPALQTILEPLWSPMSLQKQEAFYELFSRSDISTDSSKCAGCESWADGNSDGVELASNSSSCLDIEDETKLTSNESWADADGSSDAPEVANNDGTCHGTESKAEPTIGSAGHPYSCRPSCKYMWNPNGCNRGADCDHCHLCTNRRKFHRRRHKKDKAAKGAPSSPLSAD